MSDAGMTSLLTTDVGDMAARSIRGLLDASGGPGRTSAGELQSIWADLMRNDWPLLGVPESRGGAGATLIDLAAVAEEWGRHLVPLPFITTALALRWSPEPSGLAGRKVSYATPYAPGGAAPFGGASDVLVLRAPQASSLDSVDISAVTPDAFASSYPYVRTSSASSLNEHALREHAVLSVGQAVGAAAACLELSTAYASQRHQFGQPVGRFQAVRHRLADMHAALEEARSALVWSAIESSDTKRATSAAFELCRVVIEGAVQVHGGVGFTWDIPLHHYLRHVVVLARLSRSAL
jgi:alkylation response protein AidB-like acyl-CoA dehydrogenase